MAVLREDRENAQLGLALALSSQNKGADSANAELAWRALGWLNLTEKSRGTGRFNSLLKDVQMEKIGPEFWIILVKNDQAEKSGCFSVSLGSVLHWGSDTVHGLATLSLTY